MTLLDLARAEIAAWESGTRMLHRLANESGVALIEPERVRFARLAVALAEAMPSLLRSCCDCCSSQGMMSRPCSCGASTSNATIDRLLKMLEAT